MRSGGAGGAAQAAAAACACVRGGKGKDTTISNISAPKGREGNTLGLQTPRTLLANTASARPRASNRRGARARRPPPSHVGQGAGPRAPARRGPRPTAPFDLSAHARARALHARAAPSALR
ncbi:MAG: hypothetical protein J3K34DRAFT_517748 [Monoraphidium minutum]|nr:MAG: hypothetical protein J3K34DRAFT_517748 [Monoraphidium minutum]